MACAVGIVIFADRDEREVGHAEEACHLEFFRARPDNPAEEGSRR